MGGDFQSRFGDGAWEDRDLGAFRGKRWVRSVLRGVNAGAFRLMYTAVYQIFGVGYVDAMFQAGKSLADDSRWVIITATS